MFLSVNPLAHSLSVPRQPTLRIINNAYYWCCGLPSRRFKYLVASESMIPDTEALGSEPIEPDTGHHVHYRYMMVSHGGLLAWATCYEDSHISLSLIRTFISTSIPPHFHCSALYHRVHQHSCHLSAVLSLSIHQVNIHSSKQVS